MGSDFFWLKDFDCSPLTVERDSVYLFFCVHFRRTSFVARCPVTGDVRGFLLGFLPANSLDAYVHFLFVMPEVRKQGVGRALMQHFAAAAAALGARRMCLYTIRAGLFYRRLGFETSNGPFDAELASYVSQRKGAELLTCPLSSSDGAASSAPKPSG